MTRPPTALYVHVPFCTGKCSYCDFYSVVGTHDRVTRYLTALGTELRLTRTERREPVDTVYVGGGTPTSLTAGELDELLVLVHEHTTLAPRVEFTVEANPGTVGREKLRLLAGHGVNRLSLGVQSFDDRLLGRLGRRHTSSDVFDALAAARDAGFDNLGLDLIFGIPTQTVDDWRRDLDTLLTCDVPHVSTYALTCEEDTPLGRSIASGETALVGEEAELTMYETAIDVMTEAGYVHYEISNFARKGFDCAHNDVYWANGPYVGLGPSAVSYIDGERRRNVASVDAYAHRLSVGESSVGFREHLTGEKRARETAVMNLRRTCGIDFDTFRRDTGFDFRALVGTELQVLASDGLMQVDDRSAKLTHRGLMVADSVLSALV